MIAWIQNEFDLINQMTSKKKCIMQVGSNFSRPGSTITNDSE